MNGLGKISKVAAIIAAVIVIGVVVGLWGGRKPNPPAPAPAPMASEATSPAAQPGGATGGGVSVPAPPPPVAGAVPDAMTGGAGAVPQSNWEERIDAILGGEGEESVKARQMLELFPSLPTEGQVEAAQHLSNLLTDPDYAPLGNYLTNAALAEPVLDVLIADLLNRPNSVKLPLLLEVARTESHPKAGEALEILQLFLEEDFGKDWARWQTRVQQWLQENPD
ncbi:MAG TPA: hypothetical protein PKX23_11025 [Verrucomicrobiota bacterium]|jgi:hypothetical protein|nr:hypothetical protein [Verrucomicrobiota bacterium]